jgi:hypothetical protein
MITAIWLKVGRVFLAISIIGIGTVHLVTGHFPSGFLPPALAFPGEAVLAYLSGTILVGSGLVILTNKFIKFGAILSTCYFLAMVLMVHIPGLVKNVGDGGDWTGTFELLSLMSGLIVLLGAGFVSIGYYLFATGLFVFGVVHIIYEKYVITWIPGWIPFPVFWAYLVPIAFVSAFVAMLIRKYVRLATLLLALMFFLWVWIVNLPRALTLKTEPEWTGTFIALGMSGVALLIAGSVNYRKLPN